MPDEVKVRGHLRIPHTVLDDPPVAAQFTTVLDILHDDSAGFVFALDNVIDDGTVVETDVGDSTITSWWQEDVDRCADLARLGSTGWIEVTDPDGATRYVLHGGKLLTLPTQTTAMGDPTPGAAVLALTREDVTALLRVIAGDEPPHMVDVVAKLAAAL